MRCAGNRRCRRSHPKAKPRFLQSRRRRSRRNGWAKVASLAAPSVASRTLHDAAMRKLPACTPAPAARSISYKVLSWLALPPVGRLCNSAVVYCESGEKIVRALFEMASALAPAIIFLDEADSVLSQVRCSVHAAAWHTACKIRTAWHMRGTWQGSSHTTRHSAM